MAMLLPNSRGGSCLASSLGCSCPKLVSAPQSLAFFPVYLSLCVLSSSSEDMSHIEFRAHPAQYDLVLTGYICEDTVFK